MDDQTNERTNERMNERTNERMDERDITTEDNPSCQPPKRVRIRKTAPAAMKDQMTTATTTMTKATTMTTMKTPTEGGKEVVMELEEIRDFADTDNNQWTIDNGNTQQ